MANEFALRKTTVDSGETLEGADFFPELRDGMEFLNDAIMMEITLSMRQMRYCIGISCLLC
jgi:hypothetical protein|tara:strand:+ start:796 stop:978 length:183 start_codon:yes stop_codon:yes gene_type:complete